MTHRLDVTRGRDIVARWSSLAEQRLEYLTELFETGRWRRYHSEVAFLENIQEAKAAVDLSWLGRGRPTLPRDGRLRADSQRAQLRPLPAEMAVKLAPDLPIAV